jgi:hypothetical protein
LKLARQSALVDVEVRGVLAVGVLVGRGVAVEHVLHLAVGDDRVGGVEGEERRGLLGHLLDVAHEEDAALGGDLVRDQEVEVTES